MSIAAAKRRRKQVAQGNRHLAKLGRPGLPKKITFEQSAKRLAQRIQTLKNMMHNKAKKSAH